MCGEQLLDQVGARAAAVPPAALALASIANGQDLLRFPQRLVASLRTG